MITSSNPPSTSPGHFRSEPCRIPFCQLGAITAIIVITNLQCSLAQNGTSGPPPPFAPLTAKYQSDLDALAQARSKAVAPLRQSYLSALAAEEQKATAEGKQNELKAVTDDKDALTAGRELVTKPSPWLPHTLAAPRATLIHETGRAEHEYAVHAQQAGAEYLRGLVFYENSARAANQAGLLEQIAAEKIKVTGSVPGATPTGADGSRNLLLNGDFTKANESGMAENWTLGRKGVSGVTNEHGNFYFHFVDPDATKQFFFQTVDRPLDAKEVVLKLRMRAPELKGRSTYGVAVWQLDAQGNEITHERPVLVSGPVPEWKTYTATMKLLPETKKIQFRGFMDNGLTGAVDYGDFRGEMH